MSQEKEPPQQQQQQQSQSSQPINNDGNGNGDGGGHEGGERRLARKQMSETKKGKGGGGEMRGGGGDYNIWYHRYTGYDFKQSRKDREGSITRCNVARDSGRTRADDESSSSAICIHFAMGDCVKGHECSFKHEIPSEMDERRGGETHDVFGRERHKTDREDMGGVGSFSHENRTLYVSGLKAEKPAKQYEEVMRKHFGEWGEMEYVRVLPHRGIGFVRYRLRAAAEFAKVAMADQSLDEGEVLNVRWAKVDPNPIAKAADEQAATNKFVKAVEQAVEQMTPQMKAEKEALRQMEQLKHNPTSYPDTDSQFQSSQSSSSSTMTATAATSSSSSTTVINADTVASAPSCVDEERNDGEPQTKKSKPSLPLIVPPVPAENASSSSSTTTTTTTTTTGMMKVGFKFNFIGPNPRPSKQSTTMKTEYKPNPDTGELHPYSYGLYYPRQATEKPKETEEEKMKRITGLEQHFTTVYQQSSTSSSSLETLKGTTESSEFGAAQASDAAHDEPGFHNDEPL